MNDESNEPVVDTPEKLAGKETVSNVKKLVRWAAFLSIGALVCHAIDVPDHLTEWWGFSAYFVTVGAFQFFYGFGLLLKPWRYDESGDMRINPDRYGRSYYVLGLVLSVSIIVLYIISRTSGMPFFGPDAKAQSFTILSLVPVVENLPLIYCLALILHRTGKS